MNVIHFLVGHTCETRGQQNNMKVASSLVVASPPKDGATKGASSTVF